MAGGLSVESRLLKSQKRIESTKLDSKAAASQMKTLLLEILKDATSRCVSYKEADYHLDVCTIEKRANEEGIGFFTKVLPSLATALFRHVETGEAVYLGWKLQSKVAYPRFLKGIFHTVFCGYRNDVEVAYAIDCIYQIGVLCKKFQGPYKKEVLSKVYAEFCDTDKLMGTVFDRLDDRSFQTLQLARYFFRRDWDAFDPFNGDNIPRPGPGATSSPVHKSMRYEPHRFFTSHQQSFPYEDWFYANAWGVVNDARKFMRIRKYRISKPTARMKYVFKYYMKPRGICIEENEPQFLQQGLARAIWAHICKIKLQKHIGRSDQQLHRDLALESSITMEEGTLDMEGGSDRVPRDIVSWIAQDNVDFHNALMCLSTRRVAPPPELEGAPALLLNKYAPMGSGLCFPVMGLMHYYLIAAIVYRHTGNLILDKLYVYGDDIVLPSSVAWSVFSELPKFGMKLNREKSFVRSLFRESCGCHAYSGVDITPVFFRKTLNTCANSLASLIACESQFYLKGYMHAARHLRDVVETQEGKLPFVTQSSPVLGWKRPESEVSWIPFLKGIGPCKQRWNSDLHRYEVRVRVLKDVDHEEDVVMSPDQAYMRWFAQRTENSEKYKGPPQHQKVAWLWLSRTDCLPILPVCKSTLDGRVNSRLRQGVSKHFYLFTKLRRHSARLDAIKPN
jgi:hypothetical protein